jgi:hypothetical protein
LRTFEKVDIVTSLCRYLRRQLANDQMITTIARNPKPAPSERANPVGSA